MLCEWRIRKKGSNADPYVDYGAFPTIFCLKINHGGAFTPPPKIRYKGGKVNWVDAIDSDVFSVVEVNTIMKEIGYEKPSFDYYYKEPKNDLDNGLKKLSSDQDVLQMLKYVEKYKVIDLYVDPSITKESLNVDESLLVKELDNDLFIGNQELGNNDEDVIEDVSEDEWNEGMNVESNRDDGSHMDHASDREIDVSNKATEEGSNIGIDSKCDGFGLKDIVTVEKEEEFVDEEVNLEELDSGSDCEYEGNREKALKIKEIKEMVTGVAVEQRRELHLKKNDKIRFRRIYRGKVPRFSSEDEVDDSGSKGVGSSGSKEKVQSKKESQVSGKSMNKTKADGDVFKPNPKIPLNFLKDQLQKQYEVGISKQKVIRAKKMAQERVESNHTRQYAQLRDYCLELKNSNPNTTVKIEVERPEDVNSTERKFKRAKGKGIILAIAESFPSAEHRFCLKHIYDNMKLSWRGQLYKEMLWRCATSTTVKRFEKHIDKLKDFNKEAYEWLKKIPPQHWSRSHFSGRAHCDVLLNNMYEKVICKSDGPLTPNASKVLNKIMKEAGQLKDMAANGEETAIPESYCHQVHWLSTWKYMYRFKVNPCNGPDFWEKSTVPTTIIPPKINPQIGRPPKKRKKSVAELAEGIVKGNKLSRAGKSIICGKCRGIGHNQRKCPNDASTQTVTQT
ncbi:hypothetical protein Tco_0544106 [Tanacetum coccineum]